MAARNTPATLLLTKMGVEFTAHEYEVDSREGSYGRAVAAALCIPPASLFKTLIAEVDARPQVAIVPTDRQLSLKALAAAAGGKRAKMADFVVAERLTGYIRGGISPFGQKRAVPIFVDASIEDHARVYVSGGRRGLQVELAPRELIDVLSATVVAQLGVLEVDAGS